MDYKITYIFSIARDMRLWHRKRSSFFLCNTFCKAES